MSAKRQAVMVNLRCSHLTLEEIRSEHGELLAEICGGCHLRMSEYGPCHGCQVARARLTKFKGARKGWLRFCDDQCLDKWKEIKKAEAKAAKQAKAAAAPTERPPGMRQR